MREPEVNEGADVPARIGREQAILDAVKRGDGLVPLAHAKDGDPLVLPKSGVKYFAEVHGPGRVTFHRETPKLSKAEKKAAKRARHKSKGVDGVTGCQPIAGGFICGPQRLVVKP